MKSTKFNGGRIYEIALDNIEYIGYFYGKNGKETVKGAYPRLKEILGRAPDFLINAELFDFKTRAAASDVVSNGVEVRLKEGYGFAFPDNRTAVFSYKNNVGAKDYIGAYPTLARNGKEENVSIPAGIGGRRGRTALGINDTTLYVALIPDINGATIPELRKQFIKSGAIHAINLDGGGSTQFYAPNGNYFSGRKVRGFVGIWLKQGVGETYTVKVGTKLRVRSGAGYGYPHVDWLYNGDKVTVSKKSGIWCKIGEGRWVSSFYLKK